MTVETKHRIIGGLVLLAIIAIFLPLMFRHSQPESSITISAKIPKVPQEPQVNLEWRSTEETVAKISTPTPAEPMPVSVAATHDAKPNVGLAVTEITHKAGSVTPYAVAFEALASDDASSENDNVAKKAELKTPEIIAAVPVSKTEPIHEEKPTLSDASSLSKIAVTSPEAWALQLASFTSDSNAKRLVQLLRAKGMDSYTRVTKGSKGATITRVFVGPEIKRDRLEKTQQLIAKQFHLRGVIRRYKV